MTKPQILKVKKSHGTIAVFDQEKIIKAIELAGSDTGEYGSDIALKIASRVMEKLAVKYKKGDIPTV